MKPNPFSTLRRIVFACMIIVPLIPFIPALDTVFDHLQKKSQDAFERIQGLEEKIRVA
ncbi:MAG: hypothetical protein U9N83_06230 [Thermodesulfobacteriota bacterium]|nr:hypothetical protein [Thermodesulfobacteriota bacterium]